jgi:hypothetical protein
VDETERALIRDVLDSYQYTNALALVVLSALLAHYEPRPTDIGDARRHRAKAVRRQDSGVASDGCAGPGGGGAGRGIERVRRRHRAALIASMYRHLAYWPAYLALVRTMLAPLQREGRLNALTLSTRALG